MDYWSGKDLEWSQLTHVHVRDKKGKVISTTLLKELENVSARFESYCRELPVFGLNSAGYDIKLVKQYLLKELCGYYLLSGCKGRIRKYKPKVFHTARAFELARAVWKTKGLYFLVRHEHPVSKQFINDPL